MENKKDVDKKKVLKKNIISIVMYCLSMTIALMFNDLITSMFDSYVHSKHVIVKANFLVILFGIAIYTAVYLNSM